MEAGETLGWTGTGETGQRGRGSIWVLRRHYRRRRPGA
jgi:hypothetical protein